MTPEELAKMIYDIGRRLASQYGQHSAVRWEETDESTQKFMIAVSKEVLTHVGLPWPKISKESIVEMRNLMNWLEADYT